MRYIYICICVFMLRYSTKGASCACQRGEDMVGVNTVPAEFTRSPRALCWNHVYSSRVFARPGLEKRLFVAPSWGAKRTFRKCGGLRL